MSIGLTFVGIYRLEIKTSKEETEIQKERKKERKNKRKT